MKRVFVTGGSGFVCQNIIPVLIKAGFEVFALSRSEKSATKIMAVGALPIQDDLTQLTQNTASALQKCDYVLHAAAHMDFTFDPKPYYQLNVEATTNLLRLARESNVKNFVYISAAPVVPGSPIVNLTEAEAGRELPVDLYPKTKAIAERAVLAANAPGFRTLSLRPPAIWGPNNHHFDDLMSNVKEGKWRWIGGGEQILSTVHVANLAQAVLDAFHADQGGQAYFITDGDRRTIKTTFKAILGAMNLDPGDKVLPRGLALFIANSFASIWKLFRLKSRPPVAPLMIRLMGTEFSVSDAKARKELGYKNVITFEEGIRKLRAGK